MSGSMVRPSECGIRVLLYIHIIGVFAVLANVSRMISALSLRLCTLWYPVANALVPVHPFIALRVKELSDVADWFSRAVLQ